MGFYYRHFVFEGEMMNITHKTTPTHPSFCDLFDAWDGLHDDEAHNEDYRPPGTQEASTQAFGNPEVFFSRPGNAKQRHDGWRTLQNRHFFLGPGINRISSLY